MSSGKHASEPEIEPEGNVRDAVDRNRSGLLSPLVPWVRLCNVNQAKVHYWAKPTADRRVTREGGPR
jgi:hypothetical protein